MKVVVIGGVAGGPSFATRFRRLNEAHEIIIYERGENILLWARLLSLNFKTGDFS
ncbi:hypothetical protein EfmAA242_23380 [Enterococcus faecium]|nr:hypothetical protein EfmAA242_23380 [Enterococcus faecium]